MLTLFSTRRSKVDKGLSKVFTRRLAVVLVAMLCLAAVIALPTMAFAANAPVAGSTVTNATVKVIWDASALTAPLSHPVMTVRGVPVPAFVSGTNVYCTVNLTDGVATVTASVKDGTGAAQSAAPWSFTVSEAPKFGTPLIPGNGQHETTVLTAASFKATDNTAITSVAATVNGAAATVGAPVAGVYPITGFSGNQPYNTITVTANDAAGNSTIKTWGFYYAAANATAACTKCHSGADIGLAPSAGFNAGGHNTTENGIVGAHTKFDGSQGVTLHWTALQTFTVTSIMSASSTNGTAAVDVAPGTSFTSGQTGVVNSTWSLPTKAVFWPAVNDGVQNAPATAITGLSWNSVITCQDCHTGFTATGPHGATTNGGLDPNYQGDYSMAELSKQVTSTYVPANTASPGMTNGTASGIKVAPAGTTGAHFGDASVQAAMLDGTTGPSAVICAKCHRLELAVPPGTNAGQSGTTAWATVGANTPHNSHHQDTGVAQCVACHIAIPHGWKAPRLLVDGPEYAGTPWLSSNVGPEQMGTISALNNHPSIDASGDIPYGNSGAAPTTPNLSLSGTVVWDEGQCDACGDHYGQDASHGLPAGDNQGAAAPVRINF
jgi:hypothetical protein